MKIVLVMLSAVTLGSCFVPKQEQVEQVEMVDAQLVKIDTIFRYETSHSQYTWQQAQQLTWKDRYNKEYVSFATIDQPYIVGSRMTVLKAR